MAVSQSVISEILIKFQMMQGEIKEIQENLSKLNTHMVKFQNLLDEVMEDLKKFDEDEVFGTV